MSARPRRRAKPTCRTPEPAWSRPCGRGTAGSLSVLVERRTGRQSARPAGEPGDVASCCASGSADYDYVLIDAPPPLQVSDAMPLLQLVDGIVIVARMDHTSEASARAACAAAGEHVDRARCWESWPAAVSRARLKRGGFGASYGERRLTSTRVRTRSGHRCALSDSGRSPSGRSRSAAVLRDLSSRARRSALAGALALGVSLDVPDPTLLLAFALALGGGRDRCADGDPPPRGHGRDRSRSTSACWTGRSSCSAQARRPRASATC